jgi:hypothetical protein
MYTIVMICGPTTIRYCVAKFAWPTTLTSMQLMNLHAARIMQLAKYCPGIQDTNLQALHDHLCRSRSACDIRYLHILGPVMIA